MHHDEVLAPGFTDNARVGAVLRDVIADGLPDAAEYRRTAGKVDSREVGVTEYHVSG